MTRLELKLILPFFFWPECRCDKTEARPPMLMETRQMLQEFYQPFNNELADLLKDDSFRWSPVVDLQDA